MTCQLPVNSTWSGASLPTAPAIASHADPAPATKAIPPPFTTGQTPFKHSSVPLLPVYPIHTFTTFCHTTVSHPRGNLPRFSQLKAPTEHQLGCYRTTTGLGTCRQPCRKRDRALLRFRYYQHDGQLPYGWWQPRQLGAVGAVTRKASLTD